MIIEKILKGALSLSLVFILSACGGGGGGGNEGGTTAGGGEVVYVDQTYPGNNDEEEIIIASSTPVETCSSQCSSQGACSWHDGVNCSAGPQSNGHVICNDGWTGSSVTYYCH